MSEHVFRTPPVSPAVPESLPDHNLHVKVVAHRVDGIGQAYYDHVFTLEVKCESISYNIERSYVDFVDLDRRLRKVFPKSTFPALPLDAAPQIARMLKRENNRKLSTSEARQSLILNDSTSRVSFSRAQSMSMSYSGVAGSRNLLNAVATSPVDSTAFDCSRTPEVTV
jgi:hypothetical protein